MALTSVRLADTTLAGKQVLGLFVGDASVGLTLATITVEQLESITSQLLGLKLLLEVLETFSRLRGFA